MQQQPPASPYEVNLQQAYQILAGSRMQCNMFHEAPVLCIQKCLDTHDLYTLERSSAPIRYRLEKDKAEKSCVSWCGGKYDELFRRTAMKLNQRETVAVQMKAMMSAMSNATAADGHPI